jgi:type IV pilus assembly protein PilM
MAETIGLDIGSHSIKAVGLKKASKGDFLTCFGMKKIPQGIDREDVTSLSEILRDLIKEVCPKAKKARLVVSGSGVQIRRMTMPSIPKKELEQALPWEMKNDLPFPVETARIQFHILGEFIEDEVKKLDLLTVACPNDLVQRTISIAEGAGLEVSHLDVSAFALWNILMASGCLKIGETTALIDLGAEKMSLYLFKDEYLQFSREMTPAGDDLTRAVMDGIPFEKDSHLLYEKAERVKEAIGVLPGGQKETGPEEKIDLTKISFLMRPVLEKWAGEIGRSLDYYRSQFYGEKIDRIMLCGGGAHLKNFASYLNGELRLPVESFNPLKEMLYDAKRVDAQALEQTGAVFAIAAGVALPEPKKIELLPLKEPLLSKLAVEKLIFPLAPVITVLIFLGIAWYKTNQGATLQTERDEKMAKVSRLEDLRAKLAMLKEKEVKIKQDLSLFPSSVTPSVSYRQVLQEVSRMIPANITLTNLEVQSGKKSWKKAGAGSKPQDEEAHQNGRMMIYLSGLAFGNDTDCLTALAQIIESLERSPLFSHVKLIATGEYKSYNRPATEFDIACDIDTDPSSVTR